MATVRYFDPSRWDGSVPNVGLADIDEVEWDTLPGHVQRSVDSLPYFRKSAPTGGAGQTLPPQPAPIPWTPSDVVSDAPQSAPLDGGVVLQQMSTAAAKKALTSKET